MREGSNPEAACARSPNGAPPPHMATYTLPAPSKATRGLSVAVHFGGGIAGGGSCGSRAMSAELYAYRPLQCDDDIAAAVTYDGDGGELFTLPPQWLVLRPHGGPLVWIVPRAGVPVFAHSGIESVMIECVTAAAKTGLARRLCCTVVGAAPSAAALVKDEGLLKSEEAEKHARLALEAESGAIVRQWLALAQRHGSGF
eukprot:NODE_4324_length_1905_cov_5.623735.p2 GENE.NODE_4324_length_1905_cov_5.623735~~NODE_4324_length_1905_cov_5.623735.p2  ORF type:complete len:199 (-),score=61.84 NODE_4324_length_1905_cov_5.623735:1067-1663(-)